MKMITMKRSTQSALQHTWELNIPELYVTSQEALDVGPLLPSMYDYPFADVSQIPTFLVSKRARQSVTVSLSGDGGDELFGGYTRYLHTKSMWKYLKPVPKSLCKHE